MGVKTIMSIQQSFAGEFQSRAGVSGRRVPVGRVPSHLVKASLPFLDVMTAIVASLVAAWLVRSAQGTAPADAGEAIRLGLFLFLPHIAASFARSDNVLDWFGEAWRSRVLLSWGGSAVLASVMLVVLGGMSDLPIQFVLTTALLSVSIVHLRAALWYAGLHSLLRRKIVRPPAVIVIGDLSYGDRDTNGQVLRRSGCEVRAVHPLPARGRDNRLDRRQIDAMMRDLRAQTRHQAIDEILITAQMPDVQKLDEILTALADLPVTVRFMPNGNLRAHLEGAVGYRSGRRVFELQREPLSLLDRSVKRAFDVLGALAGLIALSPLLVTTALLIKLDSRGPVFFRQNRTGFNGEVFRIFKFRSMTTLDDGDVVRQATRDDARVTKVGRFIRRTSIDELPQLLNVLAGHMSLVGPRPHAVAHDSEYTTSVAGYARRQHVKPGITGWAQANGYRGETPTVDLMQSRVDHDIWYVRNWSLWLDVKTIVLTARSLLEPSKVY